MECRNDVNRQRCTCTYEPCSRKGNCCACIAYHVKNRELPGCCFGAVEEGTYNRSFDFFADAVKKGRI